jgi:hypothetical protein
VTTPGARGAPRLCALLLRAFPREFREEYGAELLRDYAELLRDTGRTRAGVSHSGPALVPAAAGAAGRIGAAGPAMVPIGVGAPDGSPGSLVPQGWLWLGPLARARGRQRAARTQAGRAGAARAWGRVLADVARSAPRERVAAVRARRASRRGDAPCPPYRAAVLAGLAVWVLYVLTLAPSIGFWDSGEYVTVAHTLGIPHPPGNALFVLLAHAWELLLAITHLDPAVRANLLSATASALAHVCWFLVADRLLALVTEDRWVRRLGAWAAVALSATAFTVWNQSNVNEKVYTISLLSTALLAWLALRWRDTGRRTAPLVLGTFVLALTATNHLMGVLAAPALLLFVLWTDARALARPRFWAAALPLTVLAFSVQLFLPIRAAQRPVIAEGDPRCGSAASAVASAWTWGHAGCPALSDVLQRMQYQKPPITVDPTLYPNAVLPRGPGLVTSQLVNYAQYFDWQWARSLAGQNPVFGGARPLVALVMLGLGLLGGVAVWRRDRAAGLLVGALFLTLSAGLVLYLNFKYGWALERAHFPEDTFHEVRERDYFFLIGFSLWGVLAGMGLADLARRASATLERRLALAGAADARRWRPAAHTSVRVLAGAVCGLALLPLPLNWHWASRAQDWTARDWAYNVLMSVEPYGVLVTNGDNDTFPLWYAQNVEGLRSDVTLVLMPYLDTAWYAKQVRDLTRPCPPGVDPDRSPGRIVCQRPFHPERMPAALAALEPARGAAVQAPEDTILPLSDAQIDAIAEQGMVTREPLTLTIRDLRTTIPAGTRLLPSDTFVAVMLRSALGMRPVHFMAPAPVLAKLGLQPYTIREGLTWRLSDGPVRGRPGDRIVAMPPGPAVAAFGAYVDLTRGDTLADEVWLRRGRITDPHAPWVDSANAGIPVTYAYALYALAEAHAQVGDTRGAQTREAEARSWTALVGE